MWLPLLWLGNESDLDQGRAPEALHLGEGSGLDSLSPNGSVSIGH